jgi:hypothetical protein
MKSSRHVPVALPGQGGWLKREREREKVVV